MVVFLCDPPRMARYVTLDINSSHPDSTDAVLQLAEVEVDHTTGACSTTTEGTCIFSRQNTDCHVLGPKKMYIAMV